MEHKDGIQCPPIWKWASQLLSIINEHDPTELINNSIDTYIEPFVGGGAIFFGVLSKFKLGTIYLLDVNPELIILFNSIKTSLRFCPVLPTQGLY